MENEEVIEQPKKNKKKKNLLFAFIKKHKIKTLLFLFIALVANTYAWFLYNRIVSADMSAHIKSWQVTIDGANNESLTFEIDDLYPGMPEYSDSAELTNEGEMDAEVSFTIKSIRILDEEYEVGVDGETVESITQKLEEDYPFDISFESSNDLVSGHGGQAELRLYVTWDFGDGDPDKDAWDTEWGEKSYDFSEDNPGVPSVAIVVDVNVSQVNPNNP